MITYHGKQLTLSLFGSSHAPSVGMILSGFPKDIPIDIEALHAFLARRAPGQSALTTSRREKDIPIFEKGLQENVTTGEPLRAVIPNRDVRSSSYDTLRNKPRPGHADYTARLQGYTPEEMRGGGPFSGRMTAPLSVAGGLALQYLAHEGTSVRAEITSVGKACDPEHFEETILRAKADGDSVGGIITCTVSGYPAGIGGPLFDGLESDLSRMLYAIPAVKGISFGEGFRAAALRGSENNDAYYYDKASEIHTETNHAGGILGGISDGEDLIFHVAFKPTPSIALPQKTVDLESKTNTTVVIEGRHDPCIVPRALPVVEAAAAVVLLDRLLDAKERAASSHAKSADLEELRATISSLDDSIIPLLLARFRVAEEVADIKRAKHLPVLDRAREEAILRKIHEKAEKYDNEIAAVYESLFEISRSLQEERLRSEKESHPSE